MGYVIRMLQDAVAHEMYNHKLCPIERGGFERRSYGSGTDIEYGVAFACLDYSFMGCPDAIWTFSDDPSFELHLVYLTIILEECDDGREVAQSILDAFRSENASITPTAAVTLGVVITADRNRRYPEMSIYAVGHKGDQVVVTPIIGDPQHRCSAYEVVKLDLLSDDMDARRAAWEREFTALYFDHVFFQTIQTGSVS